MRLRKLSVSLALTATAAAAMVVSPLAVGAQAIGTGVSPQGGGCANLQTWDFSSPLTTGNGSGTVSETYSLPYGSENPACSDDSVGAGYWVGNSIPPFPVWYHAFAQQTNWGPYSETDNWNGTCALSAVYNQFWGVTELGYLVGGAVYIGYPYLQEFGTDNFAYSQVDVFADTNPCFTQYLFGAGAEPWTGEYLWVP